MSSKNIQFNEVQRFTLSWIWLVISVLIIVVISILWVLDRNMVLLSTNLSSEEFIWISLIQVPVFVLFYFFFQMMYLEVNIKSDGIYWKYYPFVRKEKVILKTEIVSYFIGKYKPLMEYGGWGFRQTTRGSKKVAYNVKGNIGLLLKLKNGNSVLFGTQSQYALEKAMKIMMEEK